MNAARFVSLLLFLVYLCSATTIIALWTPDGTLVGSDSKIRHRNGEPAGTVCKIGIADDVFWAQSGIFSAPGTTFDTRLILSAELNSGGSLDSRISKIELRIAPLLKELLNTPSLHPDVIAHPDRYQIQILFVGYENGVSRVVLRTFSPRHDLFGNVEIEITRDGCPDAPDCGSSEYFGLGFHAEADVIARNDPAIWKNFGPRIIQRLIGVEIASRPDDVGEPIAIIASGRAGIQWVQVDGCTNQ